MKKIIILVFALFASCGIMKAQKLVIGEKAPEVKVKEWLSSKPGDDNKAKLLEFFHSSNKQCESRLPDLDAIAKKHSGKLNVIIISKEPEDKIKNILLPQSRSYYPAIDDGSKTFDGFGVRFVPFSVLIDKKGRVVWFGNPSSLDESVLKDNL